MNFVSPMLLCDFYKISHREMYPPQTEFVYSTWTARGSRIPSINHTVNFGPQMVMAQVHRLFHDYFFSQPIKSIVHDYKRILRNTLGVADPDTHHIEALHDLGYLPIRVKALPEGLLVPLRIPTLTIENTEERFFWVTNYLETLISCLLWKPQTSATIAGEYYRVLMSAAEETGDPDFVKFQGHDFSMRGMSSPECAISSGLGHLLWFSGTDTIPSIQAAEHYYHANVEKELVGTSIPASEHSVQCAYGDDVSYFYRLIDTVHPSGPVSIVADGYDYWRVIEAVLPYLKDVIMRREGGPVVIRPDSGDPVKIICGTLGNWPKGGHRESLTLEQKGTIEALWDTFGGTVNAKGYKVLDPHIGCIYGDSITLERTHAIIKGLKEKGFASTNQVLGIGSFTYQYNTRDTFGFAMKATHCQIAGKQTPICKTPKTDDGLKFSQRGLIAVTIDDTNTYTLHQNVSHEDECQGAHNIIYEDGAFDNVQTWSEIKQRLHAQKIPHQTIA